MAIPNSPCLLSPRARGLWLLLTTLTSVGVSLEVAHCSHDVCPPEALAERAHAEDEELNVMLLQTAFDHRPPASQPRGHAQGAGKAPKAHWPLLVWLLVLVSICYVILNAGSGDLAPYLRAYAFHTVNGVLLLACLFWTASVFVIASGLIAVVGRLNDRIADRLEDGGLFILLPALAAVLEIGGCVFGSVLLLLMFMVPSALIVEMDVWLFAWVRHGPEAAPAAPDLWSDLPASGHFAEVMWSLLHKASSWRSTFYCLVLKWPGAVVGLFVAGALNSAVLLLTLAPLLHAASPALGRIASFGRVTTFGESFKAMMAGLSLAPFTVVVTRALACATASSSDLVLKFWHREPSDEQ